MCREAKARATYEGHVVEVYDDGSFDAHVKDASGIEYTVEFSAGAIDARREIMKTGIPLRWTPGGAVELIVEHWTAQEIEQIEKRASELDELFET